MKKQIFDLIILGGGPGGYAAAIAASQRGLKTALIEADKLGGTCLNRGCIPTKFFLYASEIFDKASEAKQFGIDIPNISIDFKQTVAKKNQVVDDIRQNLTKLIQANSIQIFYGYGKFIGPKTIKISQENIVVEAPKIIIATGSRPKQIPAFATDHKTIFDSTSLLEYSKIPKSLAIIGGGVIGIEFACFLQAMGTTITIFEMADRIIPSESATLSSALTEIFTKKGIKIYTGISVQEIQKQKDGAHVITKDGNNVFAEKVLIAVGRSFNTENIGLEKAGVLVDQYGQIFTNEYLETNIDGIWAVGDVTAKHLLAHVAYFQGITAAKCACNEKTAYNNPVIPSVIYTHPEIASVGLNKQQASEQGFKIHSFRFPFQAIGKAHATLHTEGFAELIIDQETEKILGAQIIGEDASNLITEMTLAIQNELTLECITNTIHPHPTNSEIWQETAFLGLKQPFHIPPH